MSNLLSAGKQSQKLTLKPDDPTIVYKGDNVTFEWRYYYPSTGFKLIEVFFGIWTNPISAASSKLIVVNSSGFVQFRKEYKARLSWKGNMTPSLAVFVLHNVRPEDGNKYYGIHVEFDLHYPFIDTLKLQVKETSKRHHLYDDERSETDMSPDKGISSFPKSVVTYHSFFLFSPLN